MRIVMTLQSFRQCPLFNFKMSAPLDTNILQFHCQLCASVPLSTKDIVRGTCRVSKFLLKGIKDFYSIFVHKHHFRIHYLAQKHIIHNLEHYNCASFIGSVTTNRLGRRSFFYLVTPPFIFKGINLIKKGH